MRADWLAGPVICVCIVGACARRPSDVAAAGALYAVAQHWTNSYDSGDSVELAPFLERWDRATLRTLNAVLNGDTTIAIEPNPSTQRRRPRLSEIPSLAQISIGVPKRAGPAQFVVPMLAYDCYMDPTGIPRMAWLSRTVSVRAEGARWILSDWRTGDTQHSRGRRGGRGSRAQV